MSGGGWIAGGPWSTRRGQGPHMWRLGPAVQLARVEPILQMIDQEWRYIPMNAIWRAMIDAGWDVRAWHEYEDRAWRRYMDERPYVNMYMWDQHVRALLRMWLRGVLA